MSVVSSTLAIGSAALGVGLLRASWSRRGGGRWLTAAGWVAFFADAIVWHGAGLGWDEAIAFAMLGPSLIGFVVLGHQAGWDVAVASATRARAGRGVPRTRWPVGAHGSVGMQGSVMSGQPCGEPQRSAGAQGLVIARQREARQMGVGLRRAAQSELWESAQAGPIAAAGSRASGSLGRGTARALLGGPLALAAALGLTAFVALRLPWLEADRLVAAEFLLPTAWAVGAIWATMDSKLTRVAVTLGLTAIVCVGGTVA